MTGIKVAYTCFLPQKQGVRSKNFRKYGILKKKMFIVHLIQ
jgi:hypothetical protein